VGLLGNQDLLKENPRIRAIVMVHNTQSVGAKAQVGVEALRSTALAPR